MTYVLDLKRYVFMDSGRIWRNGIYRSQSYLNITKRDEKTSTRRQILMAAAIQIDIRWNMESGLFKWRNRNW